VLAVGAAAAWAVAPYDQEVSAFFGQRRWPSDLKRLIDLSEVMAHGLTVAVILLLIYRIGNLPKAKFWWLVACPLAGGLGANVIKLMVSRIRPHKYWELQSAVDAAQSSFVGWLPLFESDYFRESWRQSFPSGHAATAFAFAVGLSWVFPRGRAIFFGLACLGGVQRLVSNSHWPSDVISGAVVGIICGHLITHVAFRQFGQSAENAQNGQC
jgi:membrane-associated phospholipid phosphatase